MNYQIKEPFDYIGFLQAVTKYKDPIYYETAEGDCLELHSSFCQYIFGSLTNHDDHLKNGSIRFEKEPDLSVWKQYLKTGGKSDEY